MIPLFQTPPGVDRNPGNPILTADGRDLEIALLAPFSPDDVDWKPGPATSDGKKVLAFPYVDAAAIRARLTTVCGLGGWQGVPYPIPPGQMGFALAIWIRGQWVTKADGAFAGDLDLEGVSDAEYAKKVDAVAKDAKGAISNALKRAGGAWGMGEYLRQLGRVYEECEQRGRSKVLTDAARQRLYELAAKPYFRHHHDLAAHHETTAKRAFDAGALSTAFGAAKAALKIRHEVFGADHASTKAARAFFDHVVARQKEVEQDAGAQPPADATAPTAPASTPATGPQDQGSPTLPTSSEPDLRTVIERLADAANVEAVRKLGASVWKRWSRDSAEGIALRSAFEAAMQRFVPGWTVAAAEAKAAEQHAQQPAAQGDDGGAPPAARAPAGAPTAAADAKGTAAKKGSRRAA